MNNVSAEKLSAFMDGELDEVEAGAVGTPKMPPTSMRTGLDVSSVRSARTLTTDGCQSVKTNFDCPVSRLRTFWPRAARE